MSSTREHPPLTWADNPNTASCPLSGARDHASVYRLFDIMRNTPFSCWSIFIVMYRTTVLAALLVIFYAGTADAYGSLRCKGRLIDVGAGAEEVIALCGEPSRRIVSRVPVRASVLTGFTRITGYATTEQWIYDRGWGKFPAVLFLDDAKVRRIDYLPRRSRGS